MAITGIKEDWKNIKPSDSWKRVKNWSIGKPEAKFEYNEGTEIDTVGDPWILERPKTVIPFTKHKPCGYWPVGAIKVLVSLLDSSDSFILDSSDSIILGSPR